jgi:hypothetical protein
VLADDAVEQVAAGEADLVQHREDVPEPDPEPIVAPGMVTLVVRVPRSCVLWPRPRPQATCSTLGPGWTASRPPFGQS